MEEQKFENISVWIFLILGLSALTTAKVIKTLGAKENFKKNMLPIARDEQKRSGIHPDVTISQAAHESNWGLSGLTTQANNLFGFTGESWEKDGKPVLKLPTREFINGAWTVVNRPFRAYKSWAESVRDWGNLISTASRYKKAYALAQKGDVPGYAVEVLKAGYATDPGYSKALTTVYNTVKSIPEATV